MMKLNFRISQITLLDPEIINGLILLKLKDKKYEVLEVSDKSVRFYDNPWVLRWNFQQVRRLDGGRFEINVSDNDVSVIFHFYLNLLPPLIGISIPLIGTIVEGFYDGTIFFLVFIIIVLFIQTLIARNVAREMLKEILSDNIMN